MSITPKFPSGLKLIHVDLCEINKDKEPGQGSMSVPIEYPVPTTTKAVHLAVIRADLSFGSCDDSKPASFGRLTYEIAKPDDSDLANGKFRFLFQAFLQTVDPAAVWCGRFLLQVLCFG